MAVRRRNWVTKAGAHRESWIVDYADQNGDRHIQTFSRKKDADAFHASVQVDVRLGIHTPASKSPTLEEAADLFLRTCANNGLDRTTLDTYRQHVELHIIPFLGTMKLAQLTVPVVRDFADRLHSAGRSQAMVKKILVRLGSILADAQGAWTPGAERGAQPPGRPAPRYRTPGRNAGPWQAEGWGGYSCPEEIRAIVTALRGRWRPLLLTAIFCGLRASELRGLRWTDVNLKKGELHVRQRADRYNAIGRPKSAAAERVIPIPPILLNTLKEHRLSSKHDLVFANGRGNVENWGNIINRGFHPAQVAAGVTEDGKAKYTGLHALRHFYAWWCINRRADGGLELPLKVVQAGLGHSSISMTADTYGHLFPRGDDGAELAEAERILVARDINAT